MSSALTRGGVRCCPVVACQAPKSQQQSAEALAKALYSMAFMYVNSIQGAHHMINHRSSQTLLGLFLGILMLSGLACGEKADEVRQRATDQLEVAADKLGRSEPTQQNKYVTTTPLPTSDEPDLPKKRTKQPTKPSKPTAIKPSKTLQANPGRTPIVPKSLVKRKSTPPATTPTTLSNLVENRPSVVPVPLIPISTENGNYLRSGEVAAKRMVQTAMSLQRHTIWVSKPADEIEDHLAKKGFRLEGDIIEGTNGARGSQGYVAVNNDSIVVAFRGTKSDKLWETLSNIATDINASYKTIRFIDNNVPHASDYQQIDVHAGFHNEYFHVRNKVINYIERNPNKEIFVTGFSMGGALATLASFDIAVHTGRKVTGYYSGAPRVGGPEFRQAFKTVVPASYRIVINKDPGPLVPPGWRLDYVHIGHLLQLYPNGVIVPSDKIAPALTDIVISRHSKSLYLEALDELYSRCSGDNNKCPTISSMDDASRAERQATR